MSSIDGNRNIPTDASGTAADRRWPVSPQQHTGDEAKVRRAAGVIFRSVDMDFARIRWRVFSLSVGGWQGTGRCEAVSGG